MSTVTEQATEPRTAILTVDDDPGVSRAVARDLRRRYGQQFRIVRAESPSSGLEALRQMKLRGDLVAMIVADYRMPGQNGIESHITTSHRRAAAWPARTPGSGR